MKAIYTSDNIKRALLKLKNKYIKMYNKEYSIAQIIYAFNRLPGRYQDLLLKPNIDENDKANLIVVNDLFKNNLSNSKDVPSDIKIIIRNLKQEESNKKEEFSLEDTESDKGDKWVRPVEKKPEVKKVVDSGSKIRIRIVDNKSRFKPKEEIKKVEVKEEKKQVKEVKPVQDIKEEIKEVKQEEPIDNKTVLNDRLQTVIMEEYLEERKNIDIESILDKLDLDEDEKLIILVKYENNSIKTNEEVSKELMIKTSYIDEVVNKFLKSSINTKKNKVYKLEEKK